MRLVVVSNRLPIRLVKEKNEWLLKMGSGGLVTALVPVLRNRGGLWIGWAGATDHVDLDNRITPWAKDIGYTLKPVTLSREEIDKFYFGFSNEIIWPMFHDLLDRCHFDPSFWNEYKKVNNKYARVIVKNTKKKDYIWVQDYHLMLVADELNKMGVERQTGFFLHIPFPPLDIFLKLPWRSEILKALLRFDLIGFQTVRDRRNFVQCLRMLIKDAQVKGKGQILTISLPDKEVRIGHFPISIDYNDFVKRTDTKAVAERAWFFHEKLSRIQIILGLDRLDYTKGIPNRLEAFRNALIRYPELQGKITLCQVVVPSREDLPEYNNLKSRIEQLVGEINGQFTRSGWIPIHYIFRSLEKEELLAYYRTADIALITPLKDGMNLVAKEYCACNLEEKGVLILSEFAGATAELQKSALLVNPYDVEGVADAIYRAFKMPREEKKARMKKMRASIQRNNIYNWVDSFLEVGIAKRLDNFPSLEYYMPQIEMSSPP